MNLSQRYPTIPVIVFPLASLENSTSTNSINYLSPKNYKSRLSHNLKLHETSSSGTNSRRASQISKEQEQSLKKHANFSKAIKITIHNENFLSRSQSITQKKNLSLLPELKNLNQARKEQKFQKLIQKQNFDKNDNNQQVIDTPTNNDSRANCQIQVREMSQSFAGHTNLNPLILLKKEKTETDISSLTEQIQSKQSSKSNFNNFLKKYNNKIEELFQQEEFKVEKNQEQYQSYQNNNASQSNKNSYDRPKFNMPSQQQTINVYVKQLLSPKRTCSEQQKLKLKQKVQNGMKN